MQSDLSGGDGLDQGLEGDSKKSHTPGSSKSHCSPHGNQKKGQNNLDRAIQFNYLKITLSENRSLYIY